MVFAQINPGHIGSLTQIDIEQRYKTQSSQQKALHREMALLKYTFTAEDIKANTLSKLAISLEKDLELKKKYVGTKQTEYEYYHRLSKNIIDDVDCQLSRHYNFTEEELYFIINYDIKYRMGKELASYIEGALNKQNNGN